VSNESASIYEPDDDAPLQQGDILLSPVARVSVVAGPPDAAGGRPFEQVATTVSGPHAELGDVDVRVGWGPVIVTSHDCHLEKEFQRRYRQLRKEGKTKKEAIAAAEQDEALDRWLIVAPIHDPLNDIADDDTPARAAADAGLRGEVIGLCPIPSWPQRGIKGGVADLTWLSTIDRNTIVARLASMTEEGRSRLRMALARSSALRSPEIGFLLEDIVGDRIDDARRGTDNEAIVELDLRKNGTVRLLATPGEPATGGPERTRASAPTSSTSAKRRTGGDPER
jgi:hypothetical protein